MDLFNTTPYPNILPFDGEAIYFGKILSWEKANHFKEILLNEIEWKNDEAFVYGKHIITNRKVAWYADQIVEYNYSNIKRTSSLWTPSLLELKQLVEEKTKTSYNSCLLNLYHDGGEGMTWHSDNEDELLKNGSIASLSFGAERKFAMKHKKTKQSTSIILENGSLLEMKSPMQAHWLHSVPKTKKVLKPRINLTFRTYAH